MTYQVGAAASGEGLARALVHVHDDAVGVAYRHGTVHSHHPVRQHGWAAVVCVHSQDMIG